MADKQYLKLRYNTWHFQKRVPKSLKPLYPDTEVIVKSLDTGDIREARHKRDIFLGQLRQQEALMREQSNPKQRFQKYVEELTQVVKDPFHSEDDITWCEVLDPETRRKTDDPEYVEAFKVVAQGKTSSEKYGTTLQETLRHFIRVSKQDDNHTEGTRSRYEKTVKSFLWYLNVDDVMLNDIERSKVFDFIDHQRESKSGATVQGELSRLKTLWEHAYSRAWVSGDNPFEKHKIKTASEVTAHKQSFTKEELQALIKVMHGESVSMQLFTLFGLYTGARISEVVKIRLDEIVDDDGVLIAGIAQQEKGKTKAASRWIPVPKQCRELLQVVQKEATESGSLYLFHDLITLSKPDRPAYHVGKEFGKLKHKHITQRSDKGFHSFRVMMATCLERAGVLEAKAAYLLGHSVKGLSLSYGLYSKGYRMDILAEAQSKAGELIDQLLQQA